jgi:hypothetical protein
MKDSNNFKSLIIKGAVVIIMLLAALIKIVIYLLSRFSFKRKPNPVIGPRIHGEKSNALSKKVHKVSGV